MCCHHHYTSAKHRKVICCSTPCDLQMVQLRIHAVLKYLGQDFIGFVCRYFEGSKFLFVEKCVCVVRLMWRNIEKHRCFFQYKIMSFVAEGKLHTNTFQTHLKNQSPVTTNSYHQILHTHKHILCNNSVIRRPIWVNTLTEGNACF